MPQSFSSQDKTLIASVDLQSRSVLVITEHCLPLTLDLIVDLQHKYFPGIALRNRGINYTSSIFTPRVPNYR